VPCYSPLAGFKDRTTGGLTFDPDRAASRMKVACGSCLGCRLDASRTWATRITHEATLYDANCFITLTYREPWDCDEKQYAEGYYMPKNRSLNKKHFQNFMKKVRNRFPERTIRYYHCGEYGEQLQRPHYHAILFNLDFNEDKEFLKDKEGLFIYTSPTLDSLWDYGFSSVGPVNWDTAAYCARYCMKKITGPRSHDHYTHIDEYGELHFLEPEYSTMSRGGKTKDGKGGIGKGWYEKWKNDVFPADEVPVGGKRNMVLRGVPRYYTDLLKKEDGEMHQTVISARKDYMKEHAQEYTPEQLKSKYLNKRAQLRFLKRDLWE